MNTKAI